MFTVTDMRSLPRTSEEWADARDALAVAAAVGLVAVSFGALSAAAGVPAPLTVALSVLVLAGGSQFLVVAVVAAGGSPVAAVAAGLVLNLRHLSYGLAMGPVVGRSRLVRLLGAHLLIDEVVAFAGARGTGERARRAYWLAGLLLYACWVGGTVVGMLAGAAVPDPDVFGIDAAFPAALLALLLPGLRRPDNGAGRRVGTVAAVVSVLVTPVLAPGLPVLAGLLGLGAAGRVGRAGPGAPDTASGPDAASGPAVGEHRP